MVTTHIRRLTLVAVLALATALLGLGSPAAAAGPDLTITADRQTATPGSTVNLTMTLTNSQASDIWFVYQSVQPTWTTTQRKDLKYAFSSCVADGVTCSGTGTSSLGVNYAIPIAPGASRTVTLTLDIAADSGCNGTIGFYSYLYYEYDNGKAAQDGIVATPETRVVCTTEPGPARTA
ncbi:hypothetical protein ACF1G0_29880 [Streptomyces sp. NPDC013953]|uniref:hypothetical protein n=1 Tax=Streptomyces sp. NPDC013953 TaxID=3364868 RepID=UPI003702A6FD